MAESAQYDGGQAPGDRGDAMAQLPRDALTGLYNSLSFRTLLITRLGDAERSAGVAIIELRGLDRYNDAAGRTAGDALLSVLARRLDRLSREEFGQSVQVARVDGARFALLASADVPAARLRVEARAFAVALGEHLAAASPLLSLRIAVGTVTADDRAEDAMGRIARRLAAPPSQVRAIDVEAAIAGDALTIVFQPQVDMASGGVVGAEALVRWHHPRLGEIGGAVLFGAAAAAGMERPLSRAIWSRALALMAEWPEALHGIRVAVNLTAADVADPALAPELLAMARHHGVMPARLAVELTEADVVTSMDAARRSLSALRQAGLKTALDDFGTGYSGLSWLKNLPVDYIKIDGAFARDADGSARDQAVLRGVISLARALDLDVLAEGVEVESQRAWLADLGCRWYQGFLCAPALSSAAFVALAERG